MAFGISTMNALLSLTDQINQLNDKTNDFIDNGGLIGKIGRDIKSAHKKRVQYLEENDPDYFNKVTRKMSMAERQKKIDEVRERQQERARQQREADLEKRYKDHLKKLESTKFKNRASQDKAFKELMTSYQAELDTIRSISDKEQRESEEKEEELLRDKKAKFQNKYGIEQYDDDDLEDFVKGSAGIKRSSKSVSMFQNSKDPDEYLLGEKLEQKEAKQERTQNEYHSLVTSNLSEQTKHLKEINTFLKEDLEGVIVKSLLSTQQDNGLVGDLIDNIGGGGNKNKKGSKLSKIASKAGGLVKGAVGLAGKVAAPLAIAKGLYDGVSSGMDDEAILAQTGKESADDITWGDRAKHGISGAAAGLVNWIPLFEDIDASSVANTGESIMNWLGGKGYNTNKEIGENTGIFDGMSAGSVISSIGNLPMFGGLKVAGNLVDIASQALSPSIQTDGDISVGDSPTYYKNINEDQELTGIRGELAKMYDYQEEILDSVKTISLDKQGVGGAVQPVIINNTNSQTTLIPSPPRFRIQDNSTSQLSVQGV